MVSEESGRFGLASAQEVLHAYELKLITQEEARRFLQLDPGTLSPSLALPAPAAPERLEVARACEGCGGPLPDFNHLRRYCSLDCRRSAEARRKVTRRREGRGRDIQTDEGEAAKVAAGQL